MSQVARRRREGPQIDPAKNARLALVLGGVIVAMVGLAFASVPLYQTFSLATGYGGATRVTSQAPIEIVDRVMTVRFNTDVDPRLPWSFQPEVRAISLRVGETGRVFYSVRNQGARPMVGKAKVNVSPQKAGRYFSRVECFCLDQQRLEAGEQTKLSVSFFIDPAIMENDNLNELTTITLSSTFFPGREEDKEAKVELGKRQRDEGGGVN